MASGLRIEPADREWLREAMWTMAAFSGLEVLTYSILTTEFHLLVRVTPVSSLPDRDLVRRQAVLYGEDAAKELEELLADRSQAREVRAALLQRMHDLSCFFKELKLRFTVYYNRRHCRFGTVWAERFSSLLIENRRQPLLLVANYIDLSPVTRGLCEDPGDYPFCGFGEALAGGEQARAGLQKIVRKRGWENVVREYEAELFGTADSAPESRADAGKLLRTGIVFGSPQFVRKIHAKYPFITGRRRRGRPPRSEREEAPFAFAPPKSHPSSARNRAGH